MNFLRKLLKSERGAALAEYGVLIALIVLVAIASIQYMGASANASFSRVATSLAVPP
jgi:Flp pilus assembly pilin Flp